MAGMDASTARTENMRRHVAKSGGPTEWAREFGGDRWTQAQVSQWISESKPKGIGGNLARDLEAAMGLERGTLDRAPLENGAASQSPRLDASTIVDAMKALHRIYSDRDLDPPDLTKLEDAEEFARYYARTAEIEDDPIVAALVAEDRVRRQAVGGQDGREAGGASPSVGAHGPVAARKGSRQRR